MATGTATIDFGGFPGKTDALVLVVTQTEIVAGSIVGAWLRPAATAQHSADEHLVESLKVEAGNINPGVGFTIYVNSTAPWSGQWSHHIYGMWSLAWAWV